MNTYTPDAWMILKVKYLEQDLHYRIIASWSGSYLYGSSWKISSGIETFDDKGTYYESVQTSGSVYMLSKSAERVSGMIQSTFAQYKQQVSENIIFEMITLEQFLTEKEQ